MYRDGFVHLKVGGTPVGGSFFVDTVGNDGSHSIKKLTVCSGFCPGGYHFHGTAILLDETGVVFDYIREPRELSRMWQRIMFRREDTVYEELPLAEGSYRDGKGVFKEAGGGGLELTIFDDFVEAHFRFENLNHTVNMDSLDMLLFEKAISLAEVAYCGHSFQDEGETDVFKQRSDLGRSSIRVP